MDPDCRWAMSGKAFLEALRRAASGENPDIIYAELYANADHEYSEGDNAEEA